jgi:PKHD-type hydroxylase
MVRQNWRLFSGMISPQRCEEIKQLCYRSCGLHDATVFSSSDLSVTPSVRKTKVGWTEEPELMQMAAHFFKLSNRDAFNVDIDYLPPLQFGEYSQDDFYDWHYDVNWDHNGPYDRKLSFCLQLNDPSTYDGGVFEFREVEHPYRFREQGSVLIFPSYLTHRVTPVTRGVRNSLVGWIEGPRWR